MDKEPVITTKYRSHTIVTSNISIDLDTDSIDVEIDGRYLTLTTSMYHELLTQGYLYIDDNIYTLTEGALAVHNRLWIALQELIG